MSKKTNEELKQYRPSYIDYEDIEDEIMFHKSLRDDYEEELEESKYSMFPYSDPYITDPADMIYVGENGDILDDL